MNLRDLRYLVALGRHGHFGRAAEACHVSQPTLSTQLRKLEEYLDVQLVERSPQKVRLTAVGEAIAARAAGITQAADELVHYARSCRDPLAGPFTLGLIPTLGPYLLPEAMPALRQALPGLHWRLQELTTDRLLEQIHAGQVDAGLLALPVPTRGLEVIELFTEPFLLALPPGHALAERNALAPTDLPREELLLLAEGHCLRDQALAICEAAGVPARRDFEGTSLETLRHMIAAGAGMTLLPALAARDDDGLVLRRFRQPAPSRRIGLVQRQGSARGQAVAQVAETLRQGIGRRYPG